MWRLIKFGFCESFFHTLKIELVHHDQYQTRDKAA
ncbi:MAG: IS3 family transposase [Methylococcales bacterium]|nr:IS3 family transposase [Methylococcales bacterium]